MQDVMTSCGDIFEAPPILFRKSYLKGGAVVKPRLRTSPLLCLPLATMRCFLRRLALQKCKRQVLRDLGHDPNITVLGDFHSPCRDWAWTRPIDFASGVLKTLNFKAVTTDLPLSEVSDGDVPEKT